MTRDSTQFGNVLAGSMLLHVAMFFLLFALPAGVPDSELVRIYRVNVVEAPPQPKARRLDVSTRPISGLNLETPSLKVEALPEVPDTPLSAPSLQPTAPAAAATPLPEVKSPTALPALPEAPASAQPKAPASAQTPQPPALPPAIPPKAEEGSTMEQARRIAEQNRARNPGKIAKPPAAAGTALPRSRISLRMYKASVQEEVQRKYKFPGGFDKELWVRVRLIIARDGSIRSITFLERSGNEHFDRAALLSIRRTKLPFIPDGIEGDSISQVVLFRP